MDFSSFYNLLNFAFLLFSPKQPRPKAAMRMNRTRQPIVDPMFPQPWEIRWRQVNLTIRNEENFILTPCYYELTEIPLKNLTNQKFRIRMQPELEAENKICQIRFPTGLRLRYRFQFKNPNTFVFFSYGHTEKRMVAFSRKITRLEVPGMPDTFWKGIIHVPCRYSLLIFRPYQAGEVFEFRILKGHEYVDKCSKLDEIYKEYL